MWRGNAGGNRFFLEVELALYLHGMCKNIGDKKEAWCCDVVIYCLREVWARLALGRFVQPMTAAAAIH